MVKINNIDDLTNLPGVRFQQTNHLAEFDEIQVEFELALTLVELPQWHTIRRLHITHTYIPADQFLRIPRAIRELRCCVCLIDRLHVHSIIAIQKLHWELYCNPGWELDLRSLFHNIGHYIPRNLSIFQCDNTGLRKLPMIMHLNNLRVLSCANNRLKLLPRLPPNLRVLRCDNNELVQLSPLPRSLEILECFNNPLDELPWIPYSVISLTLQPSISGLNNNCAMTLRANQRWQIIVLCAEYMRANHREISLVQFAHIIARYS
jgi:Leucine-rich repeat (LRR) protein